MHDKSRELRNFEIIVKATFVADDVIYDVNSYMTSSVAPSALIGSIYPVVYTLPDLGNMRAGMPDSVDRALFFHFPK